MEEESAGPLEKRSRPTKRAAVSRVDAPARPAESSSAAESARKTDVEIVLGRMAGKSAAEILARISNGDPLGLYTLCAARTRAAYFLLDPDRVFERALAEVAVGIELDFQRCGEPDWLLGKIDDAIRSVLERDRVAERECLPPERPEEHFRFFLECFYLEPPLARLASVRYNALDERIRKGFQKLIVEGLPLEEVLAMDLGPPERLQLDILAALKAVGLLDDAGVEELRWKGEAP